jgi:tRNA-dihydrouridine synthase
MKQALAGTVVDEISWEERCGIALRHCALVRERRGEKTTAKIMRKHVAWYIKGLPQATEYRDRIFRAKSTEELEQIIRETSQQHIF